MHRRILLLLVAAILPACGTGGGGTLTPTAAPGVPAGIEALNGNREVTVAWTPSPAATGYTVKRSAAPGGPYAVLPGSAAVTGSSFVDSDVSGAASWYYVVSASNQFGTSGNSAEVRATPAFKARLIGASGGGCTTVLEDGSVWSWGDNFFGQLGDGTTKSFSSVAVRVSGLTDVVALNGGSLHMSALRSDGTVWSWGATGSGQLGNGVMGGMFGYSNVPVQAIGLTGVTQIASGSMHVVALRSDGHVWGWGENGQGQLAVPLATNTSVPVEVPGISNVVAVAASAQVSLALKADGTLWAWGYNGYGQLGNGHKNPIAGPVQVQNLTSVQAVATSTYGAFAVRTDGTAWSWGNNSGGMLGVPAVVERLLPESIPGLSNVVSIDATNGSHCLAVTTSQQLWAWGDNANGQLGDGTTDDKTVPTLIPSIAGVVAALTGNQHSIALRSDGSVWCWGNSSGGQAGDGTGSIQTLPAEVINLTGVVQISAGSTACYARRNDGTVWSWGRGYFGTLGIGSTLDSPQPVQVPLTGVTSIVASSGGEHAVALMSDGTCRAWGYGSGGALGNGGTSQSNSPVTVTGLSGVAAVSSCGHNLALKTNGQVWAWGSNGSGAIGNGTTNNQLTAIQVTGMPAAVAVAAGAGHSLAIDTNGDVWFWGENLASPISDGLQHYTPIKVPGLTNATAIVGGLYSSLVRKQDGTWWTFGYYTGSQTPVERPDLAGMTTVASYHEFGLGLDATGTAWSWGRNHAGQLGDGTQIDRPAPAAFLNGVTAIAVGSPRGMALRSNGTVNCWGDNTYGAVGIGSATQILLPRRVTH